MIRNENNVEDSVLPFLIHPLTDARGQVQLWHNMESTQKKSNRQMHSMTDISFKLMA